MEKTYQPQQIESKWYQHWEQQGYFKPSNADDAAYCIVIPPPNVTGSLHMGHGFQTTLMDTLIRLHRMRGQSTLWQVGTDHAGIATQMVVERQLEAQGQTRTGLGREAFVDKVWDWKAESGGRITQQLRRMGGSLDWSRERFTMDDGLSEAVIEVFVRLYEEDLIYKGTRLVNWDPSLHTAISDLEVISEEEQGHLWHFRYPLADDARTSEGKDYLVVATTRPETMLGDTAVAVHPDDERYGDLIGKFIELPLCNRRIPIIADDYVDQDFGTGCVKITPAHDFNDYDMGKRHDLPMINIFTADAVINDNAPQNYQGLERFAARKTIVADLDNLNLLDKIEPHTLKVPRGEKTNVVVEPYLTEQWYVRTESLAKPAIAAVENGDIEFVPKNWENTYFSWMRDIQDWCISRQLWWGHRIPAWYDEEKNVYVGQDEATVRAKYKLGDEITLNQDEDVLDTWFSSALWSFSTLGWPEKTPEMAKYHPTDVLVTGFDIIFFWVARMIMMSLKFCNEVPFRKVYIHGLIRDAHGQKMSKSKGNVLDPIDLIDGIDIDSLVEKRTAGLMQPKQKQKIDKSTREDYPEGFSAYGTDALRFTYCSLASTGRDINFDLQRMEGYRNFCNKIWNATNFVLMNTQDKDNSAANIELGTVERWILSRLQQTISAVNQGFDSYRFDLASQALYEFIWNEYCDWYLELAKVTLWDESASEDLQRGTRHTLLNVLEQILRLAHPIMPFISEEIWHKISPLLGINGESIMLQAYPSAQADLHDEQAQDDVQWLKDVIVAVRNIRGEMNIKPSQLLPVFIENGSATDQARLQRNQKDWQKIARLSDITWLNADDTAPQAATQLVGDMKVLVPLAGLIDVKAERARLGKEIDKKQKEVERVGKKLNNPKFVDKAPEAVVDKERAKLNEASAALTTLQQQLQGLDELG